MTTYDLIVPTWRNTLRALSAMIDKAAAHSKGDALLAERLAQDMFPLATQFRFVANFPGEGLVRLAKRDFTSHDDDPASLADAKDRIAETLAMLDTVQPGDFIAADEEFDMALPNGMTFRLSADQYARDWALPNFYFHTSTAYAIMRMHGVAIGKADLLPHMVGYLKPQV
ncbi:DUF1993 domain-containing protein [Qipengyuania zhejiangensis]|uniref:DUF1993 domain-containing protein n=1 Tax=Qipengyuania zhejiangensis TaxID=3077782 RepID=UPI002D7673E2|nr:DUF1993 domain-containing protein [Qipengyuania sp. Z2]